LLSLATLKDILERSCTSRLSGSNSKSRSRLADRGVLEIIALADPQEDIALQEAGSAGRHQS
jgi:hypothetical protein